VAAHLPHVPSRGRAWKQWDRERLTFFFSSSPAVTFKTPKKHNRPVDFSILFLFFQICFSPFRSVSTQILLWFLSSSLSVPVAGGSQEERPRGGCRRWTGFGLLIWPFAVKKTEEEEAVEEGASALMGL